MKEQGSAALRIVAFAVALAVVLGLASVMFSVTVSAESVESAADDTVASLGTIGNYRSIKFTAGQKLDVEFLYSAYSSSTSTNLYGRVFGYKMVNLLPLITIISLFVLILRVSITIYILWYAICL